MPVVRARYPLDQKRHLFISLIEASSLSVIQRGKAHRAGIDRLDRTLELGEALLRCPAVGAEYRFIFSGKCISESVFEDTAGPYDIRILPVVLDDTDELFLHLFGKSTFHELVCEFLRQREIPLFGALADPKIPEIIIDDIGIVEIGPNIERIMWLQIFRDIRLFIADDRPRQKHAAGLSSDHTRPDHVIPDGKIILRRKVLLDHLAHLTVARHHDIAHPAHVLRDIHLILMKDLRLVEKTVPRIRELVR